MARYDVQVSVEGGPWTDWLTDTLETEATYVAQSGQWFAFRVIATDNVSNAQSAEAASSLVRVTKYYYHGGQRVAMRADGVVYYLHGDHLGSTSLTTDASGAVVARQLYHPYGTVRYGAVSGESQKLPSSPGGTAGTLPTDFGFTGQRHDGSTGLVFMHARYYHAGLARWTQADTIVPQPGNPQDLNRYAYVRNSPLNYRDPSGHTADSYGNSWSVVDDPLAEPPSPEKVRETAVFLAIAVPTAVYGGPLLGDLAGAAYDAATLGYLRLANAHPLLTKLLLGVGGSAVTAELTDADDDEVQVAQKAQELLDELQTGGGRTQLDELDDRVMARLQQLGQSVNPSEEFAVYVTQDGQMSLVQKSQYGGAPLADAAQWPLHTHFGTGVAPSGNDQIILSALGARSGQFHFSTIIDSQGNSAFFLPWPLEKWLEIQ